MDFEVTRVEGGDVHTVDFVDHNETWEPDFKPRYPLLATSLRRRRAQRAQALPVTEPTCLICARATSPILRNIFMTRSTSSTLVNLTHTQMLPSHPQLTGKRKPEDSNPLLNAAAAKRAKKEAKLGASNKRKVNNDDGVGGLLIVRAPEVRPSHSQPTTSNHLDQPPPRFSSQPMQSSMAGPSHQPNKKFRADSEATIRPRGNSKALKPTGRVRVAYSAGDDDAEVENDVKAMEDEADQLRRQSRAHTTIDSSLLVSEVNFPPRSEPRNTTSRTKGKTKVIDNLEPLPERDTPQMERNKQLRQGAMDAIINDRSRSLEQNGKPSGHRRKSSVGGRGKRISMSFEATGVITQPHNSVSESSFYKHIDCDLPEPERVRQLLIWCTLRAASQTSSSKPPSSVSSSNPPPPPLPPLSSQGAQLLKTVQDDLVRMLAEKRINLSFYEPEASSSKQPPGELRENAQNVRNRQCEITYTQHIQQAQAEEESWKKISYGYDAYGKKLQSSLEKRSAAVQLDPGALSAKAKGKRRATGEMSEMESYFVPQEHEIPSEFQPALALAKSVLGNRVTGDERLIGGGRRGGGGTGTRSNMNHIEMEAELKRRLPDLEYKVDQIFSFVSAARTTTNIAEKMLNERFDLLSMNLTARVNPARMPTGGGGDAAPGSATALLSNYVSPQSQADGSVRSGLGNAADPLDLMRALSRVDQTRPPAQVGDAARRAAREVQRAGEIGAAAVGDRRLTGVPTTPRKAPGTPRRGNTPSRDR